MADDFSAWVCVDIDRMTLVADSDLGSISHRVIVDQIQTR
jgi:hypothetical protein